MPKTLITPFIYHPDPSSSQPNLFLSNPSVPEAKQPRRSIFCIPAASLNPFKRFRTHKDPSACPTQLSEVIQSYDGFCDISSSRDIIASDMRSGVSCMADRDSTRSISAIQIVTASGVNVSKGVCGEVPEVEEVSMNGSELLEEREVVENDMVVTKDESEDSNVPNWIPIAIDFSEGNTPSPVRQTSGEEMGRPMAACETVIQDKQAKDAMRMETLPNCSPICDEPSLKAIKRDTVCLDLSDKGEQVVLTAFSDSSPSDSISRACTSPRDISPSRLANSCNKKWRLRKLARSNAIRRYKRQTHKIGHS
ncbi:hypothetical protein C362_03596 [Cryptococcus neoformans Bt1]|nr:hypothetical protein C362_03596 [Cryptococcus neoformans var. grubii Bt1]